MGESVFLASEVQHLGKEGILENKRFCHSIWLSVFVTHVA